MYQLLLQATSTAPATVIATGTDLELRTRLANILRQRRQKDTGRPVRIFDHHYQFANGSRLRLAFVPAVEPAAAEHVA
jgi:hypothetical protein